MKNWQEDLINALHTIKCENKLFEMIVSHTSKLGYDYCAYGVRMLLPLSQPKIEMFSNYPMVEMIGQTLDLDVINSWKWDSTQWDAYCRVILMVLNGYAEVGEWAHSFILFRATGAIEHAVHDLYKINGIPETQFTDDAVSRLRVAVSYISEAIKALDAARFPVALGRRSRDESKRPSYLDKLVDLADNLIFKSASVKSPSDLNWLIQHNCVWSELFGFSAPEGQIADLFRFKLRRALFDQIKKMETFPNFKGAAILSICLNVLAFEFKLENLDRGSAALHRAVLSWTGKNYALLKQKDDGVADACLVESITYDEAHSRLMKTHGAGRLKAMARHTYLPIQPL